MLKGIAVSDGIGIGKAIIIKEKIPEYNDRTVSDISAEILRLDNALSEFCRSTELLARKIEQSVGANEADIIRGHISIVKDPYFIGECEKLIKEGKCAEAAFENVSDMFITIFSSAAEELIRQRAADMRDVKNSVLKNLMGIQSTQLSSLPGNSVIITEELTPSMISELDKGKISAFVTETGGVTSHSAIIAKMMEIPAVMSVQNAVSILNDGETIIVDGIKGTVIRSPDDAELKKYIDLQIGYNKEKQSLELFRGKPCTCASGERFDVFCNIGKAEEANAAVENDGEGIGLMRSEFLFMNRNTAPTEQQQFEEYKKAAIIAGGRPVIIRTLDVGGDKSIPYLGIPQEDNPFLGLRAVRYCLKNIPVFKQQIRAILRASCFGNIKIMFPMISEISELRKCKAVVEECKDELKEEGISFDRDIKTGIMVETPAAAICADILAKECDFFSIGTNDLTGYVMSCDRGNESVSELYSCFQPAVLRMIEQTIKCAKNEHIPVGMCGEAAADPLMIPILMSFGLDEFSVSPSSVLKVKKYISSFSIDKANNIRENVISMSTVNEIIQYIKNSYQ